MNDIMMLSVLKMFILQHSKKRKDLLRAMKGSSIPILDIKDLKKQVDEICGGAPKKPKVNKEKVVAVIKWVDGTVLDSVFQVEN